MFGFDIEQDELISKIELTRLEPIQIWKDKQSMKKFKTVTHPNFDHVFGYIDKGGDEIPTKQDKFKPIKEKVLYYKDENGNEKKIEGDIYLLNNKAKASLKKFEDRFVSCINKSLKDEHPYKKPTQLEVVINIKMSQKRLKQVDVDNLAKSVLDFMNGRIFEDDSQVRSLFVRKDIIKNELIPPIFKKVIRNKPIIGITIGIIVLDDKPSLLAGVNFFDLVEVSDE